MGSAAQQAPNLQTLNHTKHASSLSVSFTPPVDSRCIPELLPASNPLADARTPTTTGIRFPTLPQLPKVTLKMEVTLEAIIAMVAIATALPPTLLVLWNCIRRRRQRRRRTVVGGGIVRGQYQNRLGSRQLKSDWT